MPGYEVFGREELAAIVELFERNGGVALAHGFESQRKGIYKVREYEKAFASQVDARHAQAVSSGSAALKIALEVLGVGRGDEVITQAFTFVATLEAILEVNATPIIVDVDETLGMDPTGFGAAITSRTKAVIPVHMMGEPVDLDPILDIARSHGIPVLEDCAQAMGAFYKGRSVGTFGEIATFSTNAYKTIDTGEGGMIVTNSGELFSAARSIHDHGHEYSKTLSRSGERAVRRGFNYRITEFQGAVGIVQLSKMREMIERQRRNKALIMQGLRDLPVAFRKTVDAEGDIGDTLVMHLPTKRHASDIACTLREENIAVKILPDSLQWHFANNWDHLFRDHAVYSRPQAYWQRSADILERSIAIPILANPGTNEIDILIERLNRIIRRNVLGT